MDKYQDLCQALLSNGYTPVTISNFLDNESPQPEKIVLLRHDVDRKIQNALKMAELEHTLGIQSTYYFRYPYTFKPDVIAAIHAMGHEIGYHYETLSKAGGDHQKAIALFETELAAFRSIPVERADLTATATRQCPITSICMHGSPLSRYDNRDLWKTFDFQDYGIVGEAYLSIAGYDLQYLTDTGRTWGAKHSMRDKMPGGGAVLPSVATMDELIEWVGSARADGLYLTVHPERWAVDRSGWLISYYKDAIVNFGKRILIMVQ